MLIIKDNLSVNITNVAVIQVSGSQIRFYQETDIEAPYTRFAFDGNDEADKAHVAIVNELRSGQKVCCL